MTERFVLLYRRHLPHIQPPGAAIFVTFRLYGSIPREVIEALDEMARQIDKKLSALPLHQRAPRALIEHKRIFACWDNALDRADSGPTWLGNDEIACLVADAFHHWDGIKYDLLAYCIMPNHVHVVFTPLPVGEEGNSYHRLPDIMHSIKGYTAWRANKILGRQGRFWQEESYDHFARSERELERIVRYIANNPVKAGLVQSPEEWRWTYQKWELRDNSSELSGMSLRA